MSGARTSQPGMDVRPIVRTSSSGKAGILAFGAVLLIGGFGLFSAMSASREAASSPATTIPPSDGTRISSPPPLILPREQSADMRLAGSFKATVPAQQQSAPPSLTPRAYPAEVASGLVYQPPSAQLPFAVEAVGPRTVYNQPRTAPAAGGATTVEATSDRVEAGRLANPSMTVPQGTVIPAVLETAFDSTRPGGARALVQRDIYSFDGSRVLIPRGSRLYGTYEGGLNLGQRRAQISWTRLLRPDGVTIALDSPASDPLGRAGVEGEVNSHFFERFGGAILQSVLDLGVGAATRAATDGVIVALPGSTQNVTATQSQQVQPVLRVDQGTSVSVFVARDLDFASVER